MIRKSYYDKENRTDKVWYDSSTVYFSKFVENENDNFGQLYVTFKNGSTYHYVDVDMPTDYILFKSGGIDMSQGKTLNSRIKPKYVFKKINDIDISVLELELENIIKLEYNINNILEKDNIYFISGHRDINIEEFNNTYCNEINNIIENNDNVIFIMGDYYGCDIMAQNYLLDELNFDPEKVFVYHMFEKPRNVNPKVINMVGGFTSDEERDAAMTEASSYDIAYVRDHTKLSGTAQNILRRKVLK